MTVNTAVAADHHAPAITAQLTRYGRSGVPVYAVYTPGATGPRLLSEILSVDEVLGAIGAAR